MKKRELTAREKAQMVKAARKLKEMVNVMTSPRQGWARVRSLWPNAVTLEKDGNYIGVVKNGPFAGVTFVSKALPLQ